jgi:hypothetical protein
VSPRAVVLGLALIATASLGFASRFLHDPLMADEIYLVIAADHIRHAGRPLTRTKVDAAHFASGDPASASPAGERETGYALWHPPLYLHLVALVFGLTGTLRGAFVTGGRMLALIVGRRLRPRHGMTR